MVIEIGRQDALLCVDLQNDFFEQGNLAVDGSNAIIPTINAYIRFFEKRQLPIIATRDWHPENHCSFAAQGGTWPQHCVAGSKGAAFHASLDFPCSVHIVSKASKREADAYSGFDKTDLVVFLQEHGIQRLFIGGLATEYCVLATVKDALALQFQVVLLLDAMKAVNLAPEDGSRAILSMRELGAQVAQLEELV